MFGWLGGGAARKQQAAAAASAAANRRINQAVAVAHRVGVQQGRIQAGYDAAAHGSPIDRQHWVNADCLSAEQANSPGVRRTLRSRSRYEAFNNSYLYGMVRTKSNFLIGRGPRLQMQLKDPLANAFIEREFGQWMQAVRIPAKLRTMKFGKTMDGEAFGLKTTNLQLPVPVKLDLRLIEPEMVTTPDLSLNSPPGSTDGIVFDRWGNPETYHVLKYHPSSNLGFAYGRDSYNSVPASSMIHLFNVDRPGQVRGIPETTPALRLFAQLRRYTIACLGAAEVAANIALVVQSNLPVGECNEDGTEGTGGAAKVNGLEIPIGPLTASRLPEGWTIGGFKGDQPTTTYGEFKREILNEAARALNLPFNIAIGNSSSYNYSSGRLDHQGFFKDQDVERSDWNVDIMRSLLYSWYQEAILLPNYLPAGLPPFQQWMFDWFYDGLEHVDPLKEAAADELRLRTMTTTLAEIYASQGKDYEAAIRQIKKEQDLLKELGLTISQVVPGAASGSVSKEDVQQMVKKALLEEDEHVGHAKAA